MHRGLPPLGEQPVAWQRILPYIDPAHPDFIRRWLRLAAFGAVLLVIAAVIGGLVFLQTSFGRYMRAFVDISYLHRYADAERVMRTSIAEDPGDRFAPYAMLSSALEYQDRYDEALAVLDDAAARFPDDPRPQAKRCLYGVTAGQPAAVLDSCDRAIELAGPRPEFVRYRGLARALSGDLSGAQADLQAYVHSCETRGRTDTPDCVAGAQWLAEVVAGHPPTVSDLLASPD